MSLIATCILCKAQLPFESSNTWILIRHLLESHPMETCAPEAEEDSITMPLPTCNRNTPRKGRDCHPETNPLLGEQTSKIQCSTKQSSSGRKIAYKTTVAQWRPARFRVKCPKCAGRFFPTIRVASSRISNGFGAACILSCWPFCFLPALFTNPVKHHLHCSNCNAFLGLYDAQHDCLDKSASKLNKTTDAR
ncbi:uncharacterized protein LOC128723778 [Anopheles nili]|uniref:uncharacterized protein LOC128723778 n=1 Tax=Anopheles nili TaxID=185578 RepID=UPI00237BA962|nr:uncharacterized protein LOC128723778 [Anopheles nili]